MEELLLKIGAESRRERERGVLVPLRGEKERQICWLKTPLGSIWSLRSSQVERERGTSSNSFTHFKFLTRVQS